MAEFVPVKMFKILRKCIIISDNTAFWEVSDKLLFVFIKFSIVAVLCMGYIGQQTGRI